MRKNTSKIIIHCSDSNFGTANLIDSWHKARGWKGCGYHYIITNGRFSHTDSYMENNDGILQQGRGLNEIGAHCKGHNSESIGICLIGKHHFTAQQLYVTLPSILRILIGLYSLTPKDIYGHCEFSKKTCPNIDPFLIKHITGRLL